MPQLSRLCPASGLSAASALPLTTLLPLLLPLPPASPPQVQKLGLLGALKLAKPNGALFFRKVDPADPAAQQRLLELLQLMWAGKPLPARLGHRE